MNTSKPKVVVTDYTFSDLETEQQLLSAGGCELVGRQCKAEDELIDLCKDADAVITQFARVNARVIDAMTRA
ncbi:MAG TPA: C-terminal binding protein, partial [Verrucomicrobiae bacterium]|nr:C-terminal binding protein [Verrucomicrobiae bacterium]